MKNEKLKGVTGKAVKEWCEWLDAEQQGCCSLVYAEDCLYRYSVCVGWHDDGYGWKIAWKIGRQTHNNCMQTDLDIDFEMPFNEDTGDVDDTEEVIVPAENRRLGDWDALAARMRKTARRVWKDWKKDDPEE